MNYKEYNLAVDKFSDKLYGFLLKLARNQEDAEDILQETFLKLWQKRKDVPAEKAKTFLYTVAYHKFIDLTRRQKKFSDEEINPNLFGTYSFAQPDLKDIIEAALNRLPEKQRTVVMLRDYEGYSYKEIAQITGLNEGQVKVYIFRARKKIKEFIGKLENVM